MVASAGPSAWQLSTKAVELTRLACYAFTSRSSVFDIVMSRALYRISGTPVVEKDVPRETNPNVSKYFFDSPTFIRKRPLSCPQRHNNRQDFNRCRH